MSCDHAALIPVESVVTGEVLAALCPKCDTQLPAWFLDLSAHARAEYAELRADAAGLQDTIRDMTSALRTCGLLQ